MALDKALVEYPHLKQVQGPEFVRALQTYNAAEKVTVLFQFSGTDGDPPHILCSIYARYKPGQTAKSFYTQVSRTLKSPARGHTLPFHC
jgi:hypothetical protein